jgi:hypothetical protein
VNDYKEAATLAQRTSMFTEWLTLSPKMRLLTRQLIVIQIQNSLPLNDVHGTMPYEYDRNVARDMAQDLFECQMSPADLRRAIEAARVLEGQ